MNICENCVEEYGVESNERCDVCYSDPICDGCNQQVFEVIHVNHDEWYCEPCLLGEYDKPTKEKKIWEDTPENRRKILAELSESWDLVYYTTELSRNGLQWGDAL